MDVIQTFLSATVATSLMTLFSYAVSLSTSNLFKEPELLNILIKRSPLIPVNPGKRNPLGWIIHYAIGWIFVISFEIIWRTTAIEPSVADGAVLGFFYGFIGIAGWKIFFYLSPSPPEIKFNLFYLQLIIAHVIFGIGAVLLYL